VFAPGAGRFLGPSAGVAVVLLLLVFFRVVPVSADLLGLLLLALALAGFFAVFFRDPDRTPGEGVVSAADGRVRAVERDGERWRVSVFMNVSNVHVNRFPVTGRVDAIAVSGAGHRPAYRADARHNVQQSFRLSTGLGPVEVVQMTGIFARRLVSLVGVGAERTKGDRLGMVVFGSRVDVLLPAARVVPTVRVGDVVHAGTSTIAQEGS
jgi:phosphatidylserine decarboxylase